MTAPSAIALFANRNHPQIPLLEEAVRERGGCPVVCDARLDGWQGMAAGTGGLFWNGVDFSRVGAVHVLCSAVSTPPGLFPVRDRARHLEDTARFLREQERQAAVQTFLGMYAATGGLVVNPPGGAWVDHEAKAGFHEKLRAWGFPVPRSLAASDPVAARRFVKEVGQAVIKPLAGVGSTRAVTPEDLDRERLAVCPAFLQERVEGTMVRAHVVAGKLVLALAVEGSAGADSRTRPQSITPLALPGPAAEILVSATRRLGLWYAAWDAVLCRETPVLLDCNPGPYVLWLGLDHARKIFLELAGFLVEFARTQSVDRAARSVRAVSC
ncbi:MAG: hypothetical protein KKA60_06340 [Proteobacteria bacterium]|nr:hypothetical protein [Pseudomonadota bacterium]